MGFEFLSGPFKTPKIEAGELEGTVLELKPAAMSAVKRLRRADARIGPRASVLRPNQPESRGCERRGDRAGPPGPGYLRTARLS